MSKFLNANDTVDLIKSGVENYKIQNVIGQIIDTEAITLHPVITRNAGSDVDVLTLTLHCVISSISYAEYLVDWDDGTTDTINTNNPIIELSHSDFYNNTKPTIKIKKIVGDNNARIIFNQQILTITNSAPSQSWIIFMSATEPTVFKDVSIGGKIDNSYSSNTPLYVFLNNVSFPNNVKCFDGTINAYIFDDESNEIYNPFTTTTSVKSNLFVWGNENKIPQVWKQGNYTNIQYINDKTIYFLLNNTIKTNISDIQYLQGKINYKYPNLVTINNDGDITNKKYVDQAIQDNLPDVDGINKLLYNTIVEKDYIKINVPEDNTIITMYYRFQNTDVSEKSADINWGDGDTTSIRYSSGSRLHEMHAYSTPGEYIITIDWTQDYENYLYFGDENVSRTAIVPATAVKEVGIRHNVFGRYAFEASTNLTKVMFDDNFPNDSDGDKVFNLGDIARGSLFRNCTNLKNVFVGKNAVLNIYSNTSNIFPNTSTIYTTNYSNLSQLQTNFGRRVKEIVPVNYEELTIQNINELDNKLSTTGGSLTGDVTTTNTTFTNTSLVTKQYVDDTIAALNGNSISY